MAEAYREGTGDSVGNVHAEGVGGKVPKIMSPLGTPELPGGAAHTSGVMVFNNVV